MLYLIVFLTPHSSFCMLSKREKTLQTFFTEYKQKYANEKEKREAIENAATNIWAICSKYATERKDELGNTSGFFVSKVINFDAIKNQKKDIKKIITAVLVERNRIENGNGYYDKDYKIEGIFEKGLKEIGKEDIKKILWFGVALAHTKEGKYFKEVMSKVLMWGFGWLNRPVYWLLSKNSEWIEGEVEDIVTEPVKFDE